jgi:glycosyltransferase involved in cell wall biosynthesis
MLKVLIFGQTPPPVGGVTRSVKNLQTALRNSGQQGIILTLNSMFHQFDISHIHYSNSLKRLLGIILGKLVSKKVIFTLHGNNYTSNVLNSISAKICDGVIFLNEDSLQKYGSRFKNSKILTSLFKEGLDRKKDHSKTHYFKREKGYIYLLVYAYDKVILDGKDVYGIDFIINVLPLLDRRYIVILLDPKHAYGDEVKHEKKMIYLDHQVDFYQMLGDIDFYVRPTSSDGNSVAIQEAMMQKVPVLASNIVQRDTSVITYEYNSYGDFIEKLGKLSDRTFSVNYEPNSIQNYISYCNTILTSGANDVNGENKLN